MMELRFLLFVSLFSGLLSRSLEEFPKTTILDVPALFQKTNDILSFDPKLLEEQLQHHEEELPKQNNSSFTLKLYPREILLKSPFKNYRDLTLARMKRDSARVNYIYQKLNLATDVSQMDIQAPLTTGPPLGVGEYFAKFGVGTPAKQLHAFIDTGSDITWIQCVPCTKCYNQNDPVFDPSTSSSYKPLTCDSQLCEKLDEPSCKSNSCQYGISYLGGASTKGDFATETLTFGNSVANGIAIGCGRDNEGIFPMSAGLFGLGGGSVSFPSQINTPSFSYCLVGLFSASASTLDFGSSVPSDAITVPLLRDSRVPTFYLVSLSGIQIGGRMFTFREGGRILVDSGTAITRLPPNVYIALRDEFLKGVKDLPLVGPYGSFDTCFDLTSRTNVMFPAFAFLFGAKSLNLPAENYLLPVDTNVVCFAFIPTNGDAILGNIQQQGIRVVFDLERSLIGFSPKSC